MAMAELLEQELGKSWEDCDSIEKNFSIHILL